MQLSSFELRILKRIDESYPIPHDPKDNSIIAIGERPLETVGSIVEWIGESERDACVAAIKRLKIFQCVGSVHLHHPNDYVEQTIKSGAVGRLLVAKPSEGYEAFQITAHGQAVLKDRFVARLKQMLGAWVGKFADDYIPLLLALLLGMFLSSFFGLKLSIFPKLQDNTEQTDAHGAANRSDSAVENRLSPSGDR